MLRCLLELQLMEMITIFLQNDKSSYLLRVKKHKNFLVKSNKYIITKEKIRLFNNQINTVYDDLEIEKQIVTAETIKSRTTSGYEFDVR